MDKQKIKELLKDVDVGSTEVGHQVDGLVHQIITGQDVQMLICKRDSEEDDVWHDFEYYKKGIRDAEGTPQDQKDAIDFELEIARLHAERYPGRKNYSFQPCCLVNHGDAFEIHEIALVVPKYSGNLFYAWEAIEQMRRPTADVTNEPLQFFLADIVGTNGEREYSAWFTKYGEPSNILSNTPISVDHIELALCRAILEAAKILAG